MSERTTLEVLRREFDLAFATEPAAPTQRVDLLALRVGGGRLAVRISELGGVVPFRAIAPLPCEDRAMLGIAAVRGAAFPVYDLATLLGREASGTTRWMLLSAGTERIAFAFDEVEEYLRVPHGCIAAAPPPATSTAFLPSEVVRVDASMWPVISITEFLRRLEERIAARAKGH
jgi:chemotaxis signal transduction protein